MRQDGHQLRGSNDGMHVHYEINLQGNHPETFEMIEKIANHIAESVDLCQFQLHELSAIVLSCSSVNYCHPLLYEKILDYFISLPVNKWKQFGLNGIIHLIWGVSQFFELPQELISKAIDALVDRDDKDIKLALTSVSQIMFPGSRGICLNYLQNRCRHKKCPNGCMHIHDKKVIEMLLKLRYERAFVPPPIEADESAAGNETDLGELFLFMCFCLWTFLCMSNILSFYTTQMWLAMFPV